MSLPSLVAAPRLQSIDRLRGLVMLFMLLDHVRETFFLHRQVLDPMEVASTDPGLFFSRTLAHLCAPVFVLLTGLSASLYGQKHASRRAVSVFLSTRGLFLIVLELTLVNFAWTFQLPPSVLYLQVIWAIGWSMLALAAVVWLPRPALAVLGLAIVLGHNLLDGVTFTPGSLLHSLWAILHQRSWIELPGLRLRTTYPILPWIGVIALGYVAGAWFAKDGCAERRQRRLLGWGLGALALFAGLRLLNGYGEKPWVAGDTRLQTLMSLLNITKYPPSLLFLCLTLGLGLLMLWAFERADRQRWLAPLTLYGAAPLFFYLLHLYVLKVLYLGAVAMWGLNQGQYFGFDSLGSVWLSTVFLALALYPPTRAFARFKQRRRDLAWLKYL